MPVFSLIGIYVVLRLRDLLLVLWTFVPFFIDPRNAPAMAIFPLVMLASEGMYYAHTEFRRAYAASFRKKRALPEALNSLRADECYDIVYESVSAEIFAFHP